LTVGQLLSDSVPMLVVSALGPAEASCSMQAGSRESTDCFSAWRLFRPPATGDELEFAAAS
jgi:hypothetical protein